MQGIEFIDTTNPSVRVGLLLPEQPIGDMLEIDSMAKKLSGSGQVTEWIGAEPRTTRGIYWKRMCEMVHREKVAAIKGVDLTEKSVENVRVEEVREHLLRMVPLKQDPSGVHQVLNMYTGVAAPSSQVNQASQPLNVIQLAELSLFTFGKVVMSRTALSGADLSQVLLPGMDLPLQIHSDNLNGKRMFDQVWGSRKIRSGFRLMMAK
eukprot:751231-Hanusia_phi.AAC.8